MRMEAEIFHQFVREICFTHLQPHQDLPEAFGGPDGALRFPPHTRTLIESWNTQLPVTEEIFASLQCLGSLPRMSTLAVGAMIQMLVSQMPEGCMYLNVGFWHGYSLFAGMLGNADKQCVGIDNFSEFTEPPFASSAGPQLLFLEEFAKRASSQHRFFIDDYRTYFTQHRGAIGLYFYDGNHEYEYQREALELAHPHIVPGGIIIVDDTNWEPPRSATQDFMASKGGAYGCLFDQKTAHNSHPTYWNGMMVLRKNI